MAATSIENNALTEQQTISDFGPFPDPNIPSKQKNLVFVNDEYGMVEESVLTTVVKNIIREELSKILMDMGSFQVIEGSLYYGSKKLVYASDIFLT